MGSGPLGAPAWLRTPTILSTPGGCIPTPTSDQRQMTGHSDDDAEDLLAAWHAHKEAEKLFAALRDPMRQAARQGIRRILSRTPDEADVNDALFKAFKAVL